MSKDFFINRYKQVAENRYRETSGLYYEDLDIMPYLYLNIDKELNEKNF